MDIEFTNNWSYRWTKKSLMAFLEGEQTRNWIKGILKTSWTRGENLRNILSQLNVYGGSLRYNEIFEFCKKEGMI